MFKVTLTFLLFEVLVAKIRGEHLSCPDIQNSLERVNSEIDALKGLMKDLSAKLVAECK